MEWMAAALAVIFAVFVGKNDGAPLVALGLRSLGRRIWWPPLVLVVGTVALPALVGPGVAGTLASLFAAAQDSEGGLSILLAATIVTLAMSSVVGVPTSITLALVGAAAGAQVAGNAFEPGRVGAVLLLAAAVSWCLSVAANRLLA